MEKKENVDLIGRIDAIIGKGFKVALQALAVISLVAGVFSGMWHLFLIAFMAVSLLWAIDVEEKKHG